MITERLNSPSWVERIVQLRPLKTHWIMLKKEKGIVMELRVEFFFQVDI